ncbi:type II CAAX endopeptidase family protein [Nocardioides sp. CER19]|uniref:CPBP family intramembrane glutamic endopeptidase n=1 Tax=Nocardioides sp. CER19 TaxID=3038538 RepID=UPI0024482B5C|nr:type II CAAX endopeptidase family protein [Nocardioides sp. CER19]MDH2414139.1 type II CAAX endopeptidase family protein [Nocardioides sp. CER19]
MRAGLEYQEIHRGGQTSWWRALIGVFVLLLNFLGFMLFPLVLIALFTVYFVSQGDTYDQAIQHFTGDTVTPASLAFLNLALASAIPTVMILTYVLHGWLKPGWVASVVGRVRWGWLAICLFLSVLALLATLIVSALLPSAGDAGDVGGHLNPWTSTTGQFLLVIVFLTPLQAAGEEYAFRGYLTQAVGGLFRKRWVAVVVPALLFALAHGAQDAPVFFDRFAFGLVAGVLVIMTGGLEAGIAMHVLNNFLAFGLALLFGDMTDTLNASGGSWWMIPSTLTQSLVYLALVTYVARRLRIATRTSGEAAEGATELVGQTPSV